MTTGTYKKCVKKKQNNNVEQHVVYDCLGYTWEFLYKVYIQ